MPNQVIPVAKLCFYFLKTPHKNVTLFTINLQLKIINFMLDRHT